MKLLAYISGRLASMALTLWVIVVGSFLVVRLSPGSPLAQEKQLAAEVAQELRARYDLDRPLIVQLGRYLGRLATGDLGNSFKYPRRRVADLLAEAMPPTLAVGGSALLWATFVGVGAGFLCAAAPGRKANWTLLVLTTVGISLPTFVLGPLLVWALALVFQLAPAAGFGSPRHLILPALTLGIPYAASLARLAYAGMRDVLTEPYMLTARAKGLTQARRLLVHASFGALRPVITFLGPAAAGVLTGSVVVERIFGIPGMGQTFVDAAQNRDYSLVMGAVIVSSALLLVFNLLTDLTLALLDPRVRLD